jgi:glyoxylase-like metal-dependent hydrolase (beta-lactamase superfamily II)
MSATVTNATKTVGEFTITTVSDGVLYSNHDVILGVDKEDSAQLTGVAYGQPLPLDVNSFLIRHDGKLILSDAGSGHTMQPTLGKLPENLRAIGADPAAIDIIMLTHLHSDHSLGLVDPQGRAHFPKAQLLIHEVEAAFWLDRTLQPDDSERIVRNSTIQRQVTAPYRDRIRRVKDGEVLPGISAMLRPGHTPGHTNWLIQSGGERLLIWGDIVHLASVQLARPQARLIYDVDTEMAARTRATVLDFVARERLTVAGAHLSLPGFGRVVRSGERFAIEAV